MSSFNQFHISQQSIEHKKQTTGVRPQQPSDELSRQTPSPPNTTTPTLSTLSSGDDTFDPFLDGEDVEKRKEVDPTTLFVGGLELFGPGAWDEEKLTKTFSRYGGLEHVKIVRPGGCNFSNPVH